MRIDLSPGLIQLRLSRRNINALLRMLDERDKVMPALSGRDKHVEILVLAQEGREAREPAQVKALYLRDQGCTFPGCSVPAQWTIAHHHPWFSRGGATDLDKLALLCEPHHTHVHENDLECTIDDSGVTWHER